jgi:hypothetical protein
MGVSNLCLNCSAYHCATVAGIGSDTAFGGGMDALASPMGSPHDDRIKPDLELARQVLKVILFFKRQLFP